MIDINPAAAPAAGFGPRDMGRPDRARAAIGELPAVGESLAKLVGEVAIRGQPVWDRKLTIERAD